MKNVLAVLGVLIVAYLYGARVWYDNHPDLIPRENSHLPVLENLFRPVLEYSRHPVMVNGFNCADNSTIEGIRRLDGAKVLEIHDIQKNPLYPLSEFMSQGQAKDIAPCMARLLTTQGRKLYFYREITINGRKYIEGQILDE